MRNGYHPKSQKETQADSLKKQGFYHKTAWRRIRLQALQRDHYLCQECLRYKRITQATEVHHLLPLEDYPELGLELSNLQSLCWNCHEQTKHQKAEVQISGVRILKIQNGSEMDDWSRNAGSSEAEKSRAAPIDEPEPTRPYP